jgi:hypothetical protein
MRDVSSMHRKALDRYPIAETIINMRTGYRLWPATASRRAANMTTGQQLINAAELVAVLCNGILVNHWYITFLCDL